MALRPALLILLSLVTVTSAVAAPAAAESDSAPGPVYAQWEWAAADDAAIHPGVQTVVEGSQCTSNFVFVQVEQVGGVEYLTDVLLGYAGHCATSTDFSDRCQSTAYPVGHPVRVQGAAHQATVAYHATLTMNRVGEEDPIVCKENDFGLVRLHRDDWANVNPSLPVFGGPRGLNSTGLQQGERVYAWGNSSLRFGVEQTSPKTGVATDTYLNGWTHQAYMVSPGIFGDSGSGHLDAEGNAVGSLSTITMLGFTGSNNLTDVRLALQYAIDHEPDLSALRLEPGTEPFQPLPLNPGP